MKPYYEHAGITIYHGDCRQVLPQLGRFDLLLTDPPYGINVANMHEDSGRRPGKSLAHKGFYDFQEWDACAPDDDLLRMAIGAATNSILWGGNYFNLGPSRCFLVWDKDNGSNQFADAELAWTNLDKPVRLKRHMWNGMLRRNGEIRHGHPTQKPLDLMKWCISLAPDAQTVLDPFLGSGTTLVAAKAAKREATGIEREEKYCEIAAKRLSQEVFDFAS